MGSRVAYARVVDGNFHAVVDIADNATEITTKQGFLIGYFVTTATSAHTIAIRDGSTTILTLPVSLAVSTQMLPLGNIEFNTDLNILPNAVGTGFIVFVYNEYGDQV